MSTDILGAVGRAALALAVALAATVTLLTVDTSISHADACVTGPVSVVAKKDAVLKSSLRLKVYATCDGVYDATARGYLYVAGHRTGRLSLLTLTNVQVSPTTKTINIPSKILAATRSYAHRRNRHRVILKFIVSSTDRTTGVRNPPRPYAQYSQLRV